MTTDRARRKSPFANARGHHFLARPIGADSLVLDLGANHGGFAEALHSRFGCIPRLVEANPDLYEKLAPDGSFPKLHCAISTKNGSISLNIAKNDEGSSVLALPAESMHDCVLVRAVTVPGMTLDAIMAHFGLAHLDLLKMDIEGAEVAILETCPATVLQRIAQITVEFHCDPVFGFGGRDRVLGVIRRLEKLGFDHYTFEANFTDVVFVNRKATGVGLLERAALRLRTNRPRWLNNIWRALPATLRAVIHDIFGTTRG